MAEEKLFSKEAVVTAIQLTAQTIAGVVKREDAIKALESLPETLADLVMEESIKASKMRMIKNAKAVSEAFERIASKLDDEKED